MAQGGVALRLVEALSSETELMAPGGERMDGKIVRIELERLLQQGERLVGVARHMSGYIRQRVQIKLIGVEILSLLLTNSLDFRFLHARLNNAGDARGDLILEIENIFDRTVVSVGPE